MQAVILAAGRGTRMGSLTEKLPKPMLEVAGKTLLEHKFDQLPEAVTEIILVVGYLGNVIREKFGASYAGKKITYVEQSNIAGGTMDALITAQPLLKDRFFVMNGDDIYAREDMQRCLSYEWAVVVVHKEAVGTASKVIAENNIVRDIVEKEHHDRGEGFANTGLYLLDMRIFNYKPVTKDADSTEVGLPQTMVTAVNDVTIHMIEATTWLPITAPEDLSHAERALASGKK